jgi:hypothetical protein
MTELAERFARDGCVFPIRVIPEEQAAYCAQRYVDFETRRGRLRTRVRV